MSTINGKPVCDMVHGCTGHVTHIDEKGFVYCEPHGIQRKQGNTRCRKLKGFEMRFIHAGQPLRSYRPAENRGAS